MYIIFNASISIFMFPSDTLQAVDHVNCCTSLAIQWICLMAGTT